jgi:hypothetical protein
VTLCLNTLLEYFAFFYLSLGLAFICSLTITIRTPTSLMTTTHHHLHATTDNDDDHVKDDDVPLYPWLDAQPLDDRHSRDTSLDLTSQHEDDYRSPPFREADLPDTSELEGVRSRYLFHRLELGGLGMTTMMMEMGRGKEMRRSRDIRGRLCCLGGFPLTSSLLLSFRDP